ncbi:MAG: Na+/H+ antiporter subunit E [Gammaproteobacteria bacterium]|nr:Na+/H+ antiporter subunit E [Gammaproteobacteria bacterium]
MAIDTENNASAGNVAVRAVYLGLFLFGLWFLLSGSYVALLLALGFASSVFVVAIALRMHIVDRETHPIHLHSAIVFYWIWLTWEIVKANIDVARRVLDPRLPMSPNLLRVKATQKTDLGRVSYANSITLTPGTVSVRVEGDSILVHALTREAAEVLAKGEMDRRVTKIEQVL